MGEFMGLNSVAHPILSQYSCPKNVNIVVMHCIHLHLDQYQVASMEAKFANHADAHQTALTPSVGHGVNNNSLSIGMRSKAQLCIVLALNSHL